MYIFCKCIAPCTWLFKHHTTTNNVIPCMMICNHNAIFNGSDATDTSKQIYDNA